MEAHLRQGDRRPVGLDKGGKRKGSSPIRNEPRRKGRIMGGDAGISRVPIEAPITG